MTNIKIKGKGITSVRVEKKRVYSEHLKQLNDIIILGCIVNISLYSQYHRWILNEHGLH